MKEGTGETAVLWEKIVGFGTYHYRYASGRGNGFASVLLLERKA